MTRVAVIEDDPSISRVIADMLHESGHETIAYFQPSADTPQHLKVFGPELIILDARFQGPVSGWDIINALSGDGPSTSIPIILCSGAAEDVQEHRALLDRLGIPVLAKPFDMDTLQETVRRVLDESRSADTRPDP